MADNDLVQSFIAVTNAPRHLAEQFLEKNDDDLTTAIEDYYASLEDSQHSPMEQPRQSAPAPAPREGSRRSGIRTLRDLNDDPDDEDTNQNFFTGGEKSALQVENPDRDGDGDGQRPSLIESIFEKARRQMGEPDDRPSALAPEPSETRTGQFRGTGFKLGDSSQPLETIRDPMENVRSRPAKVTREIVFWRQGFTIGDGPLNRYDDPRNQSVLEELRNGRVPVSVLGVEFGQDVDVSVLKKTDEDYVPPKRKLGGFSGQGQRLGSPVPGESVLPAEPESEKKPEQTEQPKPTDQGTGDSLVQIKFASGKRVAHKFNSSDSMSVVYDFVRTHEYNSDSTRAFYLSHAFPVKPIDDASEVTVADAKLKNAVIVQRWA